jgi:hypothetical protein
MRDVQNPMLQISQRKRGFTMKEGGRLSPGNWTFGGL